MVIFSFHQICEKSSYRLTLKSSLMLNFWLHECGSFHYKLNLEEKNLIGGFKLIFCFMITRVSMTQKFYYFVYYNSHEDFWKAWFAELFE